MSVQAKPLSSSAACPPPDCVIDGFEPCEVVALSKEAAEQYDTSLKETLLNELLAKLAQDKANWEHKTENAPIEHQHVFNRGVVEGFELALAVLIHTKEKLCGTTLKNSGGS